ncbi:MAG: OmpA family protein, partial [Alphaproteobacteria bacterium]|nr:OmpA family protein [Alphaproteobacteria bacterium]
FEVNSWVLSKKGQQYLDKLVPIYIDTIFSKPELLVGIDNVVVQGHTDSQSFSGLSTVDEQFAKNMELSLKRANSVAQYMFKTDFDKQYSEQLRNMMAVEGKSFANPILKADGTEDYAKSRRVELKLKVKRMDLSKAFGL